MFNFVRGACLLFRGYSYCFVAAQILLFTLEEMSATITCIFPKQPERSLQSSISIFNSLVAPAMRVSNPSCSCSRKWFTFGLHKICEELFQSFMNVTLCCYHRFGPFQCRSLILKIYFTEITHTKICISSTIQLCTVVCGIRNRKEIQKA